MSDKIDINVYADILTRIELLKLPYVDHILDLGAGGCYLKDVIPYEDTKITFVDIENSDNGTFQTKSRLFSKMEKYSFVETSCDDLSMFEDNSFDRVVFSHLIEHLTPEQIDKTMKEIDRVLREDGDLILITPNRKGRKAAGKHMSHDGHIKEFTGSELLKLIYDYGFETTNTYRGVVFVGIPFGTKKEVLINPNMTDDIKNAYILYFVCKRKKK